ncbi:ATP-binding protein [Georgenia sp. AZ-5]|uniref:ATP-binding protein n=1 Tax=Georgenia sp. AZ-5 TaxID=3367526 RepID=UPI003755305F
MDASARERAEHVASLLDTEALRTVVEAEHDSRSLVQVLDSTGRVVVASGSIWGEPAVAEPTPEARLTTRTDLPVDEGQAYRVLVQPVEDPAGAVVVALSLAPVDRVVADTARLVLAIFPGVLALTVLVCWASVGRALAPVERIRRKAATIGAGDLSQRVPLPRAHDELRRLAETMNSMLSRIQDAHERQRHFVSDASHELRSPLANEQAMVEVALARKDLRLWQEIGADLQVEQARMRDLVDDLLLLARLDGHVPLRQREVGLDEVVHEHASRLRRCGRLRVVVAPLPALRVHGDPAQLTRVVRNLTDNARRHAATTVTLELAADGGQAVLRVGDDGAGVLEDQRERIFDRLTRLDESRGRDHGGTGLGLPISRAIAEAHGGSLVLAPTGTGAGAVFELRLPLLPEEPPGRGPDAVPERQRQSP